MTATELHQHNPSAFDEITDKVVFQVEGRRFEFGLKSLSRGEVRILNRHIKALAAQCENPQVDDRMVESETLRILAVAIWFCSPSVQALLPAPLSRRLPDVASWVAERLGVDVVERLGHAISRRDHAWPCHLHRLFAEAPPLPS